ncbi:hypothetical protein GGH99_008666, partial [Coemansia sp. RSA 1285]
LRKDAEFARKLAASDVYQQQQQQQQPLYSSVRMPSVPATSGFGYNGGGGRRPRQYSAPPMPPMLSSQIMGGSSSSSAAASPTTQTQPPHTAAYQHSSSNNNSNGNNNSSQTGFKKTSKIRNILRIGRRRSTSTGSDLHSGENEHGSIEPQHQHQHQQQVPAASNRQQAARTLESDFSDLSVTSSSASASSTHANNGANNSKPDGTDAVSVAAPMQNILDDSSSINQRNLLSSYAPLNPSKYQAPKLNNSSDAVDLEHPFDSNPLLPDPFSASSPPSSRSNNPFAAMGAQSKAADSQEEENRNRNQYHAIAFSETNPFHKRVYNNSNNNTNNSNAFQL